MGGECDFRIWTLTNEEDIFHVLQRGPGSFLILLYFETDALTSTSSRTPKSDCTSS